MREVILRTDGLGGAGADIVTGWGGGADIMTGWGGGADIVIGWGGGARPAGGAGACKMTPAGEGGGAGAGKRALRAARVVTRPDLAWGNVR